MFILVNGTDKEEKVLINTDRIQAVEDVGGATLVHYNDDIITIGDSAAKVAAMIEDAERSKKETISLIDAIERAVYAGDVAVTIKGYGGGLNSVIVTDVETGEVWRNRYKGGSEEAAALCIIDALEERKK